jgi:hypothetical protein
VVHSGTRVSSTPFGIGKAAVKALERWLDGETLVVPCMCRAVVPKIDETTVLNMIIKCINTPKIRSTRT